MGTEMSREWQTMQMTPVEDYCFLSDPEAIETFIVEFSGKVRLYHENDTPVLPGLRQTAETEHLFVAAQGKRQWKKGVYPVLQMIEPHSGRIVDELFASGKNLWRRHNNVCLIYPGAAEVSCGEYEKAQHRVTAYWDNFLSRLEEIPGVSEWSEKAWKSSFIQSFSAFWGTHTKYGVEEYGCMRHDGFPPTLLSAAGALREFGDLHSARELYLRYFERFLRPDGTLRYYGSSIAEYGQLIRLGCELSSGAGGEAFFAAVKSDLLLIYRLLRDLLDCVMNPSASAYGLLAGSPEADLRERKDEYFHNNASVLRGMKMLIVLLEKFHVLPDLFEVQDFYNTLKRRFEFAVADLGKRFSFLPYRISNPAEITSFTADMEWAFANYRYYPELLESGVLAPEEAAKIICGRFERQGMIRGLTALNYPAQYLLCFDHWPHVSLGRGLLEYGDIAHFHQMLEAHASLYMCQDLFTCYESELPGTPMKAYTDWCVPAQLAFPRLLKMCTSFTTCKGEVIAPGVPESLRK